MLPGIIAGLTSLFAQSLRDDPEERDACPHRRVFDGESAAKIRLALENNVLHAGRATRALTDALLDLPHEDPRREALYDLQRLTLQQFDFASHHLAIAEKAGLT